jgi:hypothetical protein
MESHHEFISLFERDLRADAFGICREGKPVSTFPNHALIESHADLLIPAPDGVARAAELVGLDYQHKAFGKADRTGDIEPRARLRQASNSAIDTAAAAERQYTVFEDPVPGCDPFFFTHCRGLNIAICFCAN